MLAAPNQILILLLLLLIIIFIILLFILIFLSWGGPVRRQLEFGRKKPPQGKGPSQDPPWGGLAQNPNLNAASGRPRFSPFEVRADRS